MTAAPSPRDRSQASGASAHTAAAGPEGQTRTAAPSHRVRLRRKRERGSYDRTVIDAILDEALVAHLGIVEPDGQPLVIPTLHARCGDVVYLHGSAASRTLRVLASGVRVCLTVSIVDGLVLARSAMHHSMNYRSAALFGTACVVEGAEKALALHALTEHLIPGRWADVRGPTERELQQTLVLGFPTVSRTLALEALEEAKQLLLAHY